MITKPITKLNGILFKAIEGIVAYINYELI